MVDRLDQLRAQLARRSTFAALVLSAASVFLGACSDRPGERGVVESHVQRGDGGSQFTLDSALQLFRVGLDSMSELEGGEVSIDAVVSRFVRMVEQKDTATMRRLVMSRREYAWLYYPTSPFTRPPTLQEPALNWFLHLENSQKGATRLLQRYGGRPLNLVSNSCKGPPRGEGVNRLWDDCVQRLVAGTDTTIIRLFGGIYERNGRFKLFSYSNDL